MNLTPAQNKALDLILNGNGAPVARLGGYAGTGKTTVLAEAASRAGFDVLTPTNKAAEVLRGKGVTRARTLHSVLYSVAEYVTYQGPAGDTIDVSAGSEPPEGYRALDSKLVLSAKDTDGSRPSVAVVDEASMLREDDLRALLDTYQRVVLVGDPFQLPPVQSRDVFSETVDVFLDEVHRTALDNPITAYATALRSPGGAQPADHADGKVIVQVAANNRRLMERLAHVKAQCIVWTNQLRRQINNEYRAALGLPAGEVVQGERVVVLSNVRRTDEEGNPYLLAYNGQDATAKEAHSRTTTVAPVVMHLEGVEPFMAWPFWAPNWHGLRGSKGWHDYVRTEGYSRATAELDYAYALTAHKAQGSEYGTVAVWDQRGLMRDRTEAQRWYYTAVTRARERLVLVS